MPGEWDDKRRRSRLVSAFRIWREGQSIGWECTYAELAEATGLSTDNVRDICRSRGWVAQEPDAGEPEPVDVAMCARREKCGRVISCRHGNAGRLIRRDPANMIRRERVTIGDDAEDAAFVASVVPMAAVLAEAE